MNPASTAKGARKVRGSKGSSFKSSSSVIVFDALGAVVGEGSQSRHSSFSIFTAADGGRLDMTIVLGRKPNGKWSRFKTLKSVSRVARGLGPLMVAMMEDGSEVIR